MVDIRLMSEKRGFVRERLATRGMELVEQVDKILEIDSERRRLETELQQLNADRNKLSKQIGMLRSKKEPSAEAEAQVRAIGEEITKLSQSAATAEEIQRSLLLCIPNLPHANATIGAHTSPNPVVRIWGEKPTFSYQPPDHTDLADSL